MVLKACPFCGFNNPDVWNNRGGSSYKKWVATWVECVNPDCKSRGGFITSGYREDSELKATILKLEIRSIKKWNLRKRPIKEA